MPCEKAFEIPHADFAMITPNGRILVVSDDEIKAEWWAANKDKFIPPDEQ